MGTLTPEGVRELSPAEQYFLMGSLLDDGTPERMEEAAKAYRRALEDDPDLVAALINLANIRYSRDELAEAQALYERAIALDGSYFESHFNLGNIHHDHGRYGEAEASYRAALVAEQRLRRRAFLPGGDAREDGPLGRCAHALARLRTPGARRASGWSSRRNSRTRTRPFVARGRLASLGVGLGAGLAARGDFGGTMRKQSIVLAVALSFVPFAVAYAQQCLHATAETREQLSRRRPH